MRPRGPIDAGLALLINPCESRLHLLEQLPVHNRLMIVGEVVAGIGLGDIRLPSNQGPHQSLLDHPIARIHCDTYIEKYSSNILGNWHLSILCTMQRMLAFIS